MKKIIVLFFVMLLVGCGSSYDSVVGRYPTSKVVALPGNKHNFVAYSKTDNTVRYIQVDPLFSDIELDVIVMVIPTQRNESDSTR